MTVLDWLFDVVVALLNGLQVVLDMIVTVYKKQKALFVLLLIFIVLVTVLCLEFQAS